MKKSKNKVLKLALGISSLAAIVPTIATSCTWAYKKDEPGPTPPEPVPEFDNWEKIDEYATKAHAHPKPASGETWNVKETKPEQIYAMMNESFTDQVLFDSLVFSIYIMGMTFLGSEDLGYDRGTLKNADFEVSDEGDDKICKINFEVLLMNGAMDYKANSVYRFIPNGSNKFYTMVQTIQFMEEKPATSKEMHIYTMSNDKVELKSGEVIPYQHIWFKADNIESDIDYAYIYLPWYDFLQDDGKTSRVVL